MPRGLLGTRATLVADINLILQVAIVVGLLAQMWQSRRRGLRGGSVLIQLAVIVNAVLIIAIMNPSFFRIFPFAVRNPTAPVPILLWPHMLLGIAAELIGVYLIVFPDGDRIGVSEPRRSALRIMRVLWIAAWAAGLLVYARLYL